MTFVSLWWGLLGFLIWRYSFWTKFRSFQKIVAVWEHFFIFLTDDFLVDYLRIFKECNPQEEKTFLTFNEYGFCCGMRVNPLTMPVTKLWPRPSLTTGSYSHPNLYEVSYLHSHRKLAVTRAWKRLSSHIPFQSSSFSGDMLVMLIDRGVCTQFSFAWSDRSAEVWSVFVMLGWTKTVDPSQIWIINWDYYM